MGEYILPKKTLLLWQLRGVLLSAVLIGVVRWVLGPFFWYTIIFKTMLIAALVIVFLYIPLYFVSYKIEVKETAVIIKRGVIIKTLHIMPYSRLLYAQSFATPLARLLKLSAITLKATRSYVIIPEIPKNEVEEVIRNLVSEEEK